MPVGHLAASRGQMPDRLPFFRYWQHSQVGWAERACGIRSMGIHWMRLCYTHRQQASRSASDKMVVSGCTLWRSTLHHLTRRGVPGRTPRVQRRPMSCHPELMQCHERLPETRAGLH